MATGRKKLPDFFKDDVINSVDAVKGKRKLADRRFSISSDDDKD